MGARSRPKASHSTAVAQTLKDRDSKAALDRAWATTEEWVADFKLAHEAGLLDGENPEIARAAVHLDLKALNALPQLLRTQAASLGGRRKAEAAKAKLGAPTDAANLARKEFTSLPPEKQNKSQYAHRNAKRLGATPKVIAERWLAPKALEAWRERP